MKCFSEEIIQKYIDNETSAEENILIEDHLSKCIACAKKLDDYKVSVKHIKGLFALHDEKEVGIPDFQVPQLKRNENPVLFKRIAYIAAAACILACVLMVTKKRNNDIEVYYSFELENEFNANLPISEQEMGFQVTDSEGKLINF